MRFIRLLVMILLIAPAVSGLAITEIHAAPTELAEYVEIWVDHPNGTFAIEDNYEIDLVNVTLNHTGPVLIVETNESFTSLDCPVIELGSRIGNGLANGGDSISVTYGNESDTHAYSDAPTGKSLSRCVECETFTVEEPSPCVAFETVFEPNSNATNDVGTNGTFANASMNETADPPDETCEAPTIEAEPIQEDRITYRIRAGEAYEYWIEDAFGETVRERASSSTSSTKQFTPDPTAPEHLFVIHATTTCGRVERIVGFISEAVACELTEEQVLDAVTEQLATHICRPHIEQAAMLETELDACEHPEPAMTSFYTRSRSANETYTYRSKAKQDATYLACAGIEATIDGDGIIARFDDRDLANATPILIALDNGNVIDVRLGERGDYVGSWSAQNPATCGGDAPDGTDVSEDEPDPDEDDVRLDPDEGGNGSEPEGETEDRDGSAASGHAIAPPTREDPGSIRRAFWWIVNSIRTDRSVQGASPWIVPVGFGLAGLSLMVGRT